jgi:hypothetical protein
VEVETHKVASPDVVVPTLDTVRHETLLYTWLAEHKPLGNLINNYNSYVIKNIIINKKKCV